MVGRCNNKAKWTFIFLDQSTELKIGDVINFWTTVQVKGQVYHQFGSYTVGGKVLIANNNINVNNRGAFVYDVDQLMQVI